MTKLAALSCGFVEYSPPLHHYATLPIFDRKTEPEPETENEPETETETEPENENENENEPLSVYCDWGPMSGISRRSITLGELFRIRFKLCLRGSKI